MTTNRDKVNELAEGLRVARNGNDGTWRWWLIVPKSGGPPTYVVQGPDSIIVTGDLASMVFERPGGLALGFIRRDLETGVTAKCTAGDVWEHNAEKARDDLDLAIEEKTRDEGESLGYEVGEAYDALDFSDERAVHEFYFEHVEESGEYPHLGRVLTHEFLRACACIEAVYRFEGGDARLHK